MSDTTAHLTALSREVVSNPGSARYPELGDLLIRLGRYAEAVDVCSRGLAQAERPEGRLVRGEALLLLGHVSDGQTDAARYLESRPEDPRGLRVLGECHLRAGRPDLALTPLERSARLDPSDMRTLDLLQQAEEAATARPDGAGWNDGAVVIDAPQDAPTAPRTDDPFGSLDPGPAAQRADDPFGSLDPGPAAQRADDPFGSLDPGPAAQPADDPFGPLDPGPAAQRADDPFGPLDPGPAAPSAGEPLGTFDGSAPAPGDPGPERPDDAPTTGSEKRLELDYGADRAPASAAGPDPFDDLGGASATGHVSRRTAPRSAPEPSSLGVRPPHRRMVSADRPQAQGRGAREQPVDEQRASRLLKIKIGAAAMGVLLLLGTVLGVRAWLRAAEISETLALAAAAAGRDTAGGYREAETHVRQLLDLDPTHPEALGLGAYVAARLFTAFDGGTEALVDAERRIDEANRNESVPAEAFAARGLLDLAADHMGDAVLRAEKGLAVAPGHPTLLWVRAQAYRPERPDLALADLESVRRSHPDFLPAIVTLADLLSSDGRRDDAASLLREAAERHPEHIPTLIALIGSAETGHAPADETLGRVEAVQGTLLETAGPSELCRLHVATARLALRMGRADRARAAEDTARTVVADGTCKRDLGRHLARRSRYEEASQQLALAADATADSGTAAALRVEAARAAMHAGQPRRALELLPDGSGRSRERALRSLAFLAEGRLDVARAELAPALEGRRTFAEIWAAAARLELVSGDLRAARRAVLKARRSAGQREADVLAAGRLLLDTGNPRGALAVLEPAVRRASRPSYGLLTLSGLALAGSGRKHAQRALDRLEAAIRLNPEADEAVFAYLAAAPPEAATTFFGTLPAPSGVALRALLQLEQGQAEEARTLLEGVPPGSSWVDYVAARLVEREQPSEAPARLSELLARNPARTDLAVAVGEAWLRLGRIRKAEDAFRAALQREPTHLPARIGLAETQVRGGARDPGEAMVVVRATIELSGVLERTIEDAARLQALLALACTSAGDARCSRSAAALALRQGPGLPAVRLALGRAAENSGDLRGAVEHYRLASESPGGEEGLLLAGLILAERRPADARPYLQRFVDRLPAHTQTPRARDLLERLP